MTARYGIDELVSARRAYDKALENVCGVELPRVVPLADNRALISAAQAAKASIEHRDRSLGFMYRGYFFKVKED